MIQIRCAGFYDKFLILDHFTFLARFNHFHIISDSVGHTVGYCELPSAGYITSSNMPTSSMLPICFNISNYFDVDIYICDKIELFVVYPIM